MKVCNNIYKKSFVLSTLLLLTVIVAGAQDLHFSQFYASPMTLNPSLTGGIKEDYRISAIYRNQWAGIGSSFETSCLSYDMNFKGGFLKKDMLGAGVYFYKDNLSHIVNNYGIMFSSSYHKALGLRKRHHASLGLQGGYIQKSINYSKLTTESQYVYFVFDPTMPTGENLGDDNVKYLDMQIGGSWYFEVNSKLQISSGIAVYDLTSPKESLFNGTIKNELNSRYVWHGGVEYKLKDNLSISPKFLYMNQSRGQNINIGSEVSYDLGQNKDKTLFGGLWYRVNDAAIIMAGFEYKNYKIRGSYDATASGMRSFTSSTNVKSSAKVNAFEVSIVYVGGLSRALPKSYTVPCGVF